MQRTTLVVLAAGMGSRYGGLKQMDGIGPDGETIIDYSIFDAIQAGFSKVVFVIREDFADDFKSRVSDKFKEAIEVVHVYQSLDTDIPELPTPVTRKKPWGTGHAILAAKDVVQEPFAAINADDYYGKDAFIQAHQFLNGLTDPALAAMVGYTLENTLSAHGHVNRGVCQMDDYYFLEEVVEREKIANQNGEISFIESNGGTSKLSAKDIVSMNFWLFHQDIFEDLATHFKAFLIEKREIPKSEFYIPSFVDQQIKNEELQVLVLISEDSWHGVTYQDDKEKVTDAMRTLHEKQVYPPTLF